MSKGQDGNTFQHKEDKNKNKIKAFNLMIPHIAAKE